MLEKKTHQSMPHTVEEAAELLLSDLLMQHLHSLSKLSEPDFDRLCDNVAPYLIDEFKLWQGNDALLDSCYSQQDDEETDPARIILNRVKQILHDFNGFLVIT